MRRQTDFPNVVGGGISMYGGEIGRLVFKIVDMFALEGLSVAEAQIILSQTKNIIGEESLILIRPENYEYLQSGNKQEGTT